ncbi:hypothetical protein [Pseudomonas guariconensis]|uniref:hypothetical protein n=1 Tax=Pseudomonas guariconensis TaxID=1288410 RepID=UPI002B05C491|nr:hypothetical protein [Pseudomonas guariconensis]
MFLIKIYRFVLTRMIDALNREASRKHRQARDIQRHMESLRSEQVQATKESAKLATEAERLKTLLG